MADPVNRPTSPEAIAASYAAAIQSATLLGLAAGNERQPRDACPFTVRRLADAWISGWVVGDSK